jgi:hypothetical protein
MEKRRIVVCWQNGLLAVERSRAVNGPKLSPARLRTIGMSRSAECVVALWQPRSSRSDVGAQVLADAGRLSKRPVRDSIESTVRQRIHHKWNEFSRCRAWPRETRVSRIARTSSAPAGWNSFASRFGLRMSNRALGPGPARQVLAYWVMVAGSQGAMRCPLRMRRSQGPALTVMRGLYRMGTPP